MDQANKLRDLFQARAEAPKPGLQLTARVITVTSGKGGVGKTNCTVNLAIQMRRRGLRVVIIDADFGLANIEVLLGIVPRYSLADVLNGSRTMEEVLTEGPEGVRFISGGSGLRELANVSDKQTDFLMKSFTALDSLADVIFIDTGAGISRSVVNFIRASSEAIIVTTPEPTSVTDAYALVKTVMEEASEPPAFKIVVNRIDEENEGKEIYEKLHKVAARFLNVQLEYLGAIPYDRDLVRAVKRQTPVTLAYPIAPCSRALGRVCDRLLDIKEQRQSRATGIFSFVKRLVNIR